MGKTSRISDSREGARKPTQFQKVESAISTKKIALSAVLVALTVILSQIYFPVGSSKCQPFQHMINGIAGVLLGPWYAAVMALITGTIRNIQGVGSLHAFPGGIPGALVVGLIYRYVKRTDLAALTEPLGTVVIGATISALVVAPYLGKSFTMAFWWITFAASSIPGAFLGFFILKSLRAVGVTKFFELEKLSDSGG